MFGSVFASFSPLRPEKPPLFFIFSPFSHPSSPCCRAVEGMLPNTIPMFAFVPPDRRRQLPTDASFHVKLFFAPSREQMYTAVDGESAGQRSCVPSFFPRIAAICCYL